MKLFKSFGSLALAATVAAMITGCGGQPAPAQQQSCPQDGVEAPAWVCNPGSVEGAIVDLGTAEKTGGGYGFQRRIALANARSNLAQQIEDQVKDKVEDFTRTTGIGQGETVDKVATAVSKHVAKVTLKGSKQINSWQSPKGTLFVLVAVPEKTVNEAAKEAVKTSFKNDSALWQEFQAKKGMEALEQEFKTE